jgi:hypothetical protein
MDYAARIVGAVMNNLRNRQGILDDIEPEVRDEISRELRIVIAPMLLVAQQDYARQQKQIGW